MGVQWEVMLGQWEVMGEIALEEAEDLSAIVDKVSEEAQNWKSKEDDVVGGMVEKQNAQLVREAQLAKDAFKQNGELEILIINIS